MCGILGFVSKNGMDGNNANKLILNGYYSQSERGQQSFGAVAGNDDQKMVVKSVKSIVDFTTRFAKNKFFSANLINTLIFHHRIASVGTVSKQNTHPFVAGNICLVHNGTWMGAGELKGKLQGKLQGETDSEVIAHLINERGVKALKEINGSASLVWLNKEENTLNFWRNQTPMVLGYIESMEIMLFASTTKAVIAMAIALGAKKIGGIFHQVYLLETTEHVYYQCHFEENLKIKQKVINPKPPQINYYNAGFINNYQTNHQKVYSQNLDLFDEDRDWDDCDWDSDSKFVNQQKLNNCGGKLCQ